MVLMKGDSEGTDIVEVSLSMNTIEFSDLI
jgi:hypothetical protein